MQTDTPGFTAGSGRRLAGGASRVSGRQTVGARDFDSTKAESFRYFVVWITTSRDRTAPART